MAIVNFCGFETGDFIECSNASSSGCSVQSLIVNNGNYALKIKPDTSTGKGYADLYSVSATGVNTRYSINTVYIRFYFRHEMKPASGSEEICTVLANSGGIKMPIRINSLGKLSIYDDSSNTLIAEGNTVLDASTWYRIEIKCGTETIATNDGVYELKIDGITELSGTGNIGTDTNGAIRLGINSNKSSQFVEYYYDDVAISDSGWIGTGKVIALLPDGDGFYAGWTESTESKHKCVSDIPSEARTSETKFISSAINPDTYSASLHSAYSVTGTISGVKSVAVLRTYSIGTASCSVLLKSDATTTMSTLFGLTTSYAARQIISLTDPADSTSWTVAKLNNVEVGVYNASTVVTRCTLLALMVSFSGIDDTPVVPPTQSTVIVTSISPHSETEIDVTYSAQVDSSALDPLKYSISGDGKGTLNEHPDSVSQLSGNTYRLSWSSGILRDDSERDHLEMLMELDELPKTHYCFSTSNKIIQNSVSQVVLPRGQRSDTPDPDDDYCYVGPASWLEACRICKSVSVSLDSIQNPDDRIRDAITIAGNLNVPLGINFSPWSEIVSRCNSPCPKESELNTEINFVKNRLSVLQGLIEDYRVSSGITVTIGAFLFDDERYGEFTDVFTGVVTAPNFTTIVLDNHLTEASGSSEQPAIEYCTNRIAGFDGDIVIFDPAGNNLTRMLETVDYENYSITVSGGSLPAGTYQVNIQHYWWPEYMLSFRNQIYDACKEKFPDVSFEYYSFGGIAPDASSYGWGDNFSHNRLFTMEEKTDYWSCPTYKTPYNWIVEESYKRTVDSMDDSRNHGLHIHVTPWLALGTGYQARIDSFHEWVTSWNYPYVYDWVLGAEINDLENWYSDRFYENNQYAPWDRANYVAFYPGYFIVNQSTGEGVRNSNWTQRFIAYVRGATGANPTTIGLKGLGDSPRWNEPSV